jgi:hypothetical protein
MAADRKGAGLYPLIFPQSCMEATFQMKLAEAVGTHSIKESDGAPRTDTEEVPAESGALRDPLIFEARRIVRSCASRPNLSP